MLPERSDTPLPPALEPVGGGRSSSHGVGPGGSLGENMAWLSKRIGKTHNKATR